MECWSLMGGKNLLIFCCLELFDNCFMLNFIILGLERGFDLNFFLYFVGVLEEIMVVWFCFWLVGLGVSILENVKCDGLGGILWYIICCWGLVLVIIFLFILILFFFFVLMIGGSLRVFVRDIGSLGICSLNYK